MNKGMKRLCIGYMLSLFHITVGELEILPGFVAWLIVLSALYMIMKAEEYIEWVSVYHSAELLVAVSFLFFIIVRIPNNMFTYIGNILTLPIIGICELILEYKILKTYCQTRAQRTPDISREYGVKAKNYALIFTTFIIAGTICLVLDQQQFSVIIVILMFIARLYYLEQLYQIKKLLEKETLTYQP